METYYSELKADDCTVHGGVPDAKGVVRTIWIMHPVFGREGEKRFNRYEEGKKVYWRHKIDKNYGFIIKADISQRLSRKRR